MDTLQKVELLGQAAQYDVCASHFCGGSKARGSFGRWIYPSVLPDGKNVLLLKVLMTNACENDCSYCANKCSRDFPRHSFQPEELSKLFIELKNRHMVEGLFLSSAISKNPARTMDEMIKTVEILRLKYRFPGYIHLKILPGASLSYVERAIELADRVSINLEAPNQERLSRISANKDFDDLLLRMKWIKAITSRGKPLSSGHTTQFVVGAADETDRELLGTTWNLYQKLGLTRAYFSAFRPVEGTPLEGHSPTSPIREHRLYQADFLLRQYGFKFEELTFDVQENLPLNLDPKVVWALNHPEKFPVEVNKASYHELLRVPGIGPRSASRIVRDRLKSKFHTLEELRSTGAVVRRAAPFILINGRSQEPLQLELWGNPV